ncbi:MAG: hypothetical protein ACP5LQ_09050, partial [Candidatus Methanodesulfokora sp.]
MLPVILQITAGITICLILTRNLIKSVVISPLTGAIFLAAVSPVINVEVFVVIEGLLILTAILAIRRAEIKMERNLIMIFIFYLAIMAVNLYKEPYVASWFNQDEPFHLMRSKLYAMTGSPSLDYPFLVHLIGGSCYKLGGEWYLWYRTVLALLIPSEGALIYMIAEELRVNPVLASFFYLLMNPSMIHLFEIGTYSNELLDALILLDAYLLIRGMMAQAAIVSLMIPISNSLGWIFIAYACLVSLLMRSKRILSLIPSIIWLFLPLSAGRIQTYAAKAEEGIPLGVKLAVIEGIPLEIWSFFGASFSLGIAGLLARSSWERKRRYASLYALFISFVVIVFAVGSPSLCWRFILLLPFPLSITAACLMERFNLLAGGLMRLASPAVLLLLLLASPPLRGNTPYQDGIPFIDRICKEHRDVNISTYGASSFPSVFGCSVFKSAALEDLLLNGSSPILTRKTQLERLLVEKDPCIKVISSSGSFDLIEYRPEGHQRAAGLYMNSSFALIYLNADVIAVTTAYGALCSLLDPLAARCPDLTV